MKKAATRMATAASFWREQLLGRDRAAGAADRMADDPVEQLHHRIEGDQASTSTWTTVSSETRVSPAVKPTRSSVVGDRLQPAERVGEQGEEGRRRRAGPRSSAASAARAPAPRPAAPPSAASAKPSTISAASGGQGSALSDDREEDRRGQIADRDRTSAWPSPSPRAPARSLPEGGEARAELAPPPARRPPGGERRSASAGARRRPVAIGRAGRCPNRANHVASCAAPVARRGPRARSSIRSSGSSRPMWSRTSGPGLLSWSAVRSRSGSTGTTRLS